MSKKRLHRHKESRPKPTVPKLKRNISILPSVDEMVEALAAEDRRDVSAEIAWLISAEYERRHQRKAA